MGFFSPKWMSNDKSKALKAVEKITDPKKLAEVAVNAKLQIVVQEATERIHDEAVLAGIALGDAGFFAVGKALERVTHPDLLKQIADEAEQDWVRMAALKRLADQNQSIDLLPYQDLINRCVRGGNIEAVNLCKDRAFLEAIYLDAPQRFMNKEQKSKVMISIKERINRLAYETVQDSHLSYELERFVDHNNMHLYSDIVRNAAQRKLNSMILPENASQEELYKAALNNSAVREEALSRLSNPELLAKIARSNQFSPGTRVQIAVKAGIGNPFGRRTLVCPECGKPAVYTEMYESIDSWKIEGEFQCQEYKQGCAWSKPDNPLDRFIIGDGEFNWQGDLVFLCPSCGRLRAYNAVRSPHSPTCLMRCSCGNQEQPVPVQYDSV